MGKRKKLLGLVLVVCMLFTLTPITSRADVTTEKWTDFTATDFAGGSGTKDDPYQIATAGQLAKLASEVNSGVPEQTHLGEYFKLTAPIDLSGKRWIPIGYGNASSKAFSGYFDGNNQVITGLYVDERGNNVCAGLFGVVVAVSDETVLKNFCIKNATIYAGNSTDANASPDIYGAGVLVGSLTTMGGSRATFVGVENCQGTGQVDSKMYAGGLIGDASRAHVSDCSADVTVTGRCISGGFIGNVFQGSYKNCTAKGSVSGWSTGGFAGCVFESDASVEIEHCASYGNVEANNWNTGGFVGYLEKGKIRNSVSYGNVKSTVAGWEPKTGGFSGTNTEGNIQNCNAAGTVTGSHPTIAPGGFIGYDNNGTTAGCAFDKKKNPSLNDVGADSGTPGSNQIKAADTNSLLSNICGSYLGGHTLSKVDRKEATHLTEGNIQYWVCANCGGYFSDANGANMITALDVVIAKTAEHTADRTGWHSDADNHWNTCECGEKINQSGHSFTWVIDKEATSTEKGSKHEQCTVCNYAKTAVEIPPVKTGTEETKTSYKIIEGTESSYVLQSGNSLTIRVDAEFSKFAGIKVDGVQIGKDNYDVKSGSTIVTLKSSYLNTLTAGTHNLEMLWTDGSASTTFTIQASVNQNPDNKNQETATASNTQPATQTNKKQTTDKSPKTGDYNNPLVWAAWLIVSEIIIAGTVYYRKKKHL